MKNIVTKKTEITYEMLFDILVTAFEGGSNYWYTDLAPMKETSKKDNSTDRFYDDLITNGFTLRDKESEGNDLKTVTPSELIKAAQLMSDKHSRHFNDWISSEDDAITGDVFLQLAVFKDVIYG